MYKIIKWDFLFNVFLKKYAAITLWPFIFIKSDCPPHILIHEKVHIKQQLAFWILGFYFIYILQYIFFYIKYRNHWKAYYTIGFEQEAYLVSHKNFRENYMKLMRS